MAALTSCSANGRISGSAPPDRPLPAGIELAFNHHQNHHYRSPISGQLREGDDLEAFVLESIAAARQEILVAVQELSLPKVAEALAAKRQQGVVVKVVLENTYSTPWSQEHMADLVPHQRKRHQQMVALGWGDAVLILQRGGVPLIDDTADGSAGSGLMHHKFMVIDRKVVVTGSTNFTPSCIHGDPDDPQTRGNVNHLLRFHSPELAAVFAAEFERMWGDGPGGEADSQFGIGKEEGPLQEVMVGATKVGVLFAPHRRQDPNQGLLLIADLLAQARKNIDLALFVFSEQGVADVLAQLQTKGVAIRLLADPGFANRSFSEVLDLLGTQLPDRDCKLEVGNKPWKAPLEGVGTPRLAPGDKLHHKLAVIDHRTVITGSFNWSPSAAHQNDETLLVIESPLLAAHFSDEIDRLWRGAELGITSRLERKQQRQRNRCGSGVQRAQRNQRDPKKVFGGELVRVSQND
ncbi:phosphatidylserine/phosphatidylglycerophosphate/cardiolipin synthase family protein [Cyanobium sp. WAJ14-Wanaka]|uniref:phosphatidylserine/phosphatidylglycerophosphate/ cardiolipin synthase family protein n=1 Tax=Cyanobium sp. WAJ14-Wanaka TaxID=2823725 RepID=UPI0037BF9258